MDSSASFYLLDMSSVSCWLMLPCKIETFVSDSFPFGFQPVAHGSILSWRRSFLVSSLGRPNGCRAPREGKTISSNPGSRSVWLIACWRGRTFEPDAGHLESFPTIGSLMAESAAGITFSFSGHESMGASSTRLSSQPSVSGPTFPSRANPSKEASGPTIGS